MRSGASMMRLDLRLEPLDGVQDLAWLAESTSALHDIYSFIVSAFAEEEIAAAEAERTRPLTRIFRLGPLA
jgi:hypothetical protein